MRKAQRERQEHNQNIVTALQSVNHLNNKITDMQDMKTHTENRIKQKTPYMHTSGQIKKNKKNLQNHQKRQNKQENNSITYQNFQKRQKIPVSLKNSLRKKALQQGQFMQYKNEQKPKIFDLLRLKFKNAQITCKICLSVVKNQQDTLNLCKCPHIFCKNCLLNYVTYKVKMFQQVVCPQQNCNLVMNQQTQFYNNLTQQQKKNYTKIHHFYTTSTNSSLKLCPKQNCQGTIQIKQGQARICNKCQKQFCSQCYLQKHQGNCDENQVNFLQYTLRFKQCSNCRFVVQKIDGCNHIVCKCKYQFCYVCGKKWQQHHKCDLNTQNNSAPNNYNYQGFCCCQNVFGRTCAQIINIPVRILLSLFITIIFFLFGISIIIVIILFFIISIISGIFGYSIDWLYQQYKQSNTILALISTVIFPIAMLIGIYIGINQMFTQNCKRQLKQFYDILKDGYQAIWN